MVHDDYLLKGRDALIKSVQSNGEQLANLNNPSKIGNNLEMKRKTMRGEGKILKNSSNKVATPEILASNEESLKGTSFRLPSIIIKSTNHESRDFNEKKRSSSIVDENEQSTSIDQH